MNAGPPTETTDTNHLPYYSDGSRFWLNNGKKWVSLDRDTFKVYLAKIPSIDAAEIESIMCEICVSNQLDYIGPLSGYRPGFRQIGDLDVLISKTTHQYEPEQIQAGDWSLIETIIHNMFSDEENQIFQHEYLFTWLKHAIDSYYEFRVTKGLCLILVGERKSGKSLLLDILVEMFGRKRGLPFAHLSGEEKFNKDLFGATLQIVDDETSDTAYNQRKRLAQKTKNFVATSEVWCRGMHKEGIPLNPLWRLIMCCNSEPENLNVLPVMSNDIRDKFLILYVQKEQMPRKTLTDQDREAFWQEIKSQIPAFIHYLRFEHRYEDNLLDRFGCTDWIHPHLEDAMFETTKAFNTWKVIQKWIHADKYCDPTRGFDHERPQIIHETLMDAEDLTLEDKKTIGPHLNHFGCKLAAMANTVSLRNYIQVDKKGNNRWYTISKQDEK